MARTVKKPEERRREIIAAARELFQTQQYETTTMKDVMEKLGIAKGTIYHYFGSKEALLEAVVEQTVDEYVAAMQTLLDETEGTALERMQILITASDIAEEEDQMLEQLHRPGNIGMHTRQLAVTISKLAPLYAGVIQQGCDEGIFQTEHPLECAEFLLTSLQFLSDIGIHPWTEADLMRRVIAFPALVEAQLKAPQGSFAFLVEQT
jgi:AcrR family transcriptional regulator